MPISEEKRIQYKEAKRVKREAFKEQVLSFFGRKCQICGYDKHPNVLEVHHVDKSKKTISIGEYGRYKPWKEVEEELQECVLLCANCHREVHAGLVEIKVKPLI